jgi:acetyl-CoA carboxylase carboxyl transferase subunit alpha
MADRFGLPILCFIDTPGAYPGVQAEERHVAEAIAVNLREMSLLRVPILATVIGVGDRVLVLENSYYSVISPEGCAAILWKNRSFADRAAEALKLTSADLLEMGLADEVITEPLGGAHTAPAAIAASLKAALVRNLQELQKLSTGELLQKRYDKFRAHGRFTTVGEMTVPRGRRRAKAKKNGAEPAAEKPA